MRKTFLSAASVFAILAGTALAQNATTSDSSQGQAPAATAPAPTKPMSPPEKMGTDSNAMSSGSQAQSGGNAVTPQSGTTAEQPQGTTGNMTAEQPSSGQDTGQAAQQQMPATGSQQAASAEEPSGPPVSAKDIIGQKVYGSDGKSLGEVSDAVVDSSSGKISKLVISSGGFLGLGAKTIALDMSQVKMAPGEGIKANDVTQDQVEQMPEFKVASATESLEPSAPATGGTSTQ